MSSNMRDAGRVKIDELVRNYIDNYNYIVRSEDQEEATKQKLIQPFFRALGWDFEKIGKESEVRYEGAMIRNGRLKKVDYVFGKEYFYLEAKKADTNFWNKDRKSIVQASEYAWTKKKFCILTDFKELLLIKPCKPNPKKPEISVVSDFSLNYNQYLDRFDLIYDTFSKEAVYSGSLERLLEREKRARKFFMVDDDFLNDLEIWRKRLASNIYKNNRVKIGKNSELLTEYTQRVLDRIIFTRILEDKGIEPRKLEKYVGKIDVFSKLNTEFKYLRKYNGIIYNEHAIDDIVIDDKAINEVLENVCDTSKKEVVYQFDQIPVEILGSIYERFLGKAIRIYPENKREPVKVEKKELVKSTGIYYTPDYIVKFIVTNSLGNLLGNKSMEKVKNIRIADIACGSGSFLVGTYTYLLDWYTEYYNERSNNKKDVKEITETIKMPDGTIKSIKSYKLTRRKRKEILQNHIFGVDIDPQAVEVTQMSLYLKMLEDCPDIQIELPHGEFILPDMSGNIKCGNSLADDDQKLNEEQRSRIKPFNWDIYFPDIIKWQNDEVRDRKLEEGFGFDIIIGNPPYVKEYVNRKIFEDIKRSYIGRYYEGKMDYWYLFACRAIDLLKHNGMHSFIATNNWNTNYGASFLRDSILNNTKMMSLVDFVDFKVFQKASIQTMIYLLKKGEARTKYSTNILRITDKNITETEVKEILEQITLRKNIGINSKCELFQSEINNKVHNGKPFVFNNQEISRISNKIKIKGNYALVSKDIGQGIVAPQEFIIDEHLSILKDTSIKLGDGIFIIDSQELKKLNLSESELRDVIRPYYTTKQVHRYYGDSRNESHILYTDIRIRKNMNKYMKTKEHLDKYKSIISSDFAPYGLHRARKEHLFSNDSILSLRKTKYPFFTYVDFPCYVSQTFFVLQPKDIDLKYLTALLNSRLIYFWLFFNGKKQGEQLQIDKRPLLDIPIVKTDNIEIQRKLVSLMEEISVLIRRRYTINITEHEKEDLRIRIESNQEKIDRIVYGLYGLIEDDINFVENSVPEIIN